MATPPRAETARLALAEKPGLRTRLPALIIDFDEPLVDLLLGDGSDFAP
jgi:hypothetical protein